MGLFLMSEVPLQLCITCSGLLIQYIQIRALYECLSTKSI